MYTLFNNYCSIISCIPEGFTAFYYPEINISEKLSVTSEYSRRITALLFGSTASTELNVIGIGQAILRRLTFHVWALWEHIIILLQMPWKWPMQIIDI
jgi:hypothetical protein